MTPAPGPRGLTAVLSGPPDGAGPVNHPMADGPGLFEITGANGDKGITNVRRLAGSGRAPDRC